MKKLMMILMLVSLFACSKNTNIDKQDEKTLDELTTEWQCNFTSVQNYLGYNLANYVESTDEVYAAIDACNNIFTEIEFLRVSMGDKYTVDAKGGIVPMSIATCTWCNCHCCGHVWCDWKCNTRKNCRNEVCPGCGTNIEYCLYNWINACVGNPGEVPCHWYQ